MSSTSPPNHGSNRRNVCAVCLNHCGSQSSKRTYLMNEDLATQLKKLFPEYSHDSQRFPCGLCSPCYQALARMKSGKQNFISTFESYIPAAINVKENATDCSCFMCSKPHNKSPTFSKEQQPVRGNAGHPKPQTGLTQKSLLTHVVSYKS